MLIIKNNKMKYFAIIKPEKTRKLLTTFKKEAAFYAIIYTI